MGRHDAEGRQLEIDIANHWNQVAEQMSKPPAGDPGLTELKAELDRTSKLPGSPSAKYWDAYVPKS